MMIDELLKASPEELAAAIIRQSMATKEVTGTPTSYYTHGPGGIFAVAGAERPVISTHVMPTGLLSVIPAYGTRFMNPLYPYLTGFQDDTGTNPAGVCDDCIQAGIKKACYQTAQFGRYCRETKEFDVNRLAQLRDRSEPTDLRLINPVYAGNKLTPAISNQDPLANEIAQAMVEVGISFERLLSQQVWVGNPANNNVGGGYREFPGLEILVATGKIDALTQTSCPSLDSDIKDFNYKDVCDLSGTNIIETLTYGYRFVSKLARTTGMEPVDLRWVMREELFYELTSCWPCAYYTYRCWVPDTANIDAVPSVEAEQAVKLRDDMRNGRYLLVDGRKVPVIFDDGITEETDADSAQLNAGEFASDIYLLPFSVRGNIATLYMEHLNYTAGHAQLASGPGAMFANDYLVTDGGMFSWTKSRQNWCFLWLAAIEPRILLRTPHLALRVQNVKYEPLQHTRQPFPDDGYFVDGGITTVTERTLYGDWGAVT